MWGGPGWEAGDEGPVVRSGRVETPQPESAAALPQRDPSHCRAGASQRHREDWNLSRGRGCCQRQKVRAPPSNEAAQGSCVNSQPSSSQNRSRAVPTTSQLCLQQLRGLEATSPSLGASEHQSYERLHVLPQKRVQRRTGEGGDEGEKQVLMTCLESTTLSPHRAARGLQPLQRTHPLRTQGL